ncbi:MAG: hypothetical protein LBB74_03665 [Chitinispirillales bacterium]|jgi:hypothetical protein|nr:hypothetical protein [Chitinispirillales bacterium]
MKHSKKSLILLTAAVCLFSFGGCYTRLASYQGEVTEAGSKGGGCGDCREEVPYTGNRQVCVWERDFFGYPELKCYYTSYTSSWLYFHNTPWWYRSSYGWRDTRGCPPYYYYDRFSGTCRYYGGSSYPGPNTGTGGGGGGGSGAAKHEQAPPRRNGRVVLPSEGAVSAPVTGSASTGAVSTPSNPMFSGGLKTLSPAPSPIRPPAPSATEENSSQGMSKPQDGASNHAPSQPQLPQQQTPPPQKRDDTPQGPPPRRNPRGM